MMTLQTISFSSGKYYCGRYNENDYQEHEEEDRNHPILGRRC